MRVKFGRQVIATEMFFCLRELIYLVRRTIFPRSAIPLIPPIFVSFEPVTPGTAVMVLP